MELSNLNKIGDIHKGHEIGKNHYSKYIWLACEKCGQQRWVFLDGYRKGKSKICHSCANSTNGIKAFHPIGQRVNRICGNCRNEYTTNPLFNKVYCSNKCRYEDLKGKPAHNKGILLGDGIYNNLGYRTIYKPNHPQATQNKHVSEHRLVMEAHLGRYLKPEEVVHHIDGNRGNNDFSNLMLFANQNEHLSYHRRFDVITKAVK